MARYRPSSLPTNLVTGFRRRWAMLRGRVRRWLVATFPGSGRTLASLALIAILLIMTGGMAVNLVNQLVIARHLEVELAAANTQVASLQATTQALAQQLEYERSDAAAEAWARDLGLAREGDVVIVPERVPSTTPAALPVVTPSPVPLPSPPPNWQRWWQAFFP